MHEEMLGEDARREEPRKLLLFFFPDIRSSESSSAVKSVFDDGGSAELAVSQTSSCCGHFCCIGVCICPKTHCPNNNWDAQLPQNSEILKKNTLRSWMQISVLVRYTVPHRSRIKFTCCSIVVWEDKSSTYHVSLVTDDLKWSLYYLVE